MNSHQYLFCRGLLPSTRVLYQILDGWDLGTSSCFWPWNRYSFKLCDTLMPLLIVLVLLCTWWCMAFNFISRCFYGSAKNILHGELWLGNVTCIWDCVFPFGILDKSLLKASLFLSKRFEKLVHGGICYATT